MAPFSPKSTSKSRSSGALTVASDLLYYAARFFIWELPRLVLFGRRDDEVRARAVKRLEALRKGSGTTTTEHGDLTITNDDSRIAVIIPCLNEDRGIQRAILSALSSEGGEGVELVVVDGGSKDGSRTVCAELGVRVLEGDVMGCKCRADSMNMGVGATTAPILVFLHADTTLPKGYGQEVRAVLQGMERGWGIGAFALAFASGGDYGDDDDSGDKEPPGMLLRFICWSANMRSRWLKMPYGDQALFMRREVFEALGSFQSQPLLEDVDLVCLASSLGLSVTTSTTFGVCTSARRWRHNGTLLNTGLNQAVLVGRALGVPVSRLALWYYGIGR